MNSSIGQFVCQRRNERPSSSSSAKETIGLANRLRQLLRHDGASTSFLGGGESDRETRSEMPEFISGYRLIREIGVGGMGVVYEGEQVNPRRRVALKVVHRGPGAARIQQRFQREAQVLAMLKHPGIAHIYESGTEVIDGVPASFFAMELIDGLPLNRFVHEHQLSARQVLELVARVCDAVQYAHQMGVIHRDLKPANVLVSRTDPNSDDTDDNSGAEAVGRPKVLDFGIARFVASGPEDESVHTQVGQVIGTLAYMSPEQVEGHSEDLDARCDVYAIGVILYELLGGTTPFDISNRSLAEVSRIIREEEPRRLGTIRTRLRGDIETIVARAMEKDRDRRYESAVALADDIRRYLRNEAILARPASALYQLQKFTRRNRGLVTGIAVAFVAMALGMIGTGVALRATIRANTELDAANTLLKESNANLQQVAEFQSDSLGSIDPQVLGSAMREAMLSEVPTSERPGLELGIADVNFTNVALAALDTNMFDPWLESIESRFADQPEVAALLLQSIAGTMRDIGLLEAAQRPQEDAARIRRETLGTGDPLTLESERSLANLALERGDLQTAETILSLLDARCGALGEDHVQAVLTRIDLGLLRIHQSRLDEGEALCRDAYERAQVAFGAEDPVTLKALHAYARAVYEQGRVIDAEPLLADVLRRRRAANGPDAPETLAAMVNLAALYTSVSRYEDAEKMLLNVFEHRRGRLGDAHPLALTAMNALGVVYQSQGRLDDAHELYEEALRVRRETVGADHPDTLIAANNLASILDAMGRYPESEALHRETLGIKRRVLGNDHRSTLFTLGNLGSIIRLQGRPEEAEPFYREMLEGMRRTLGNDDPNTLQAVQSYGILLVVLGRFEEAEPLYMESLEGRRQLLGDDHPATLNGVFNMGNLLWKMGKLEEAEPYCVAALDGYRRIAGEDHEGTIHSLANLGELRISQGRIKEAEALYREQHEKAARILGDKHPGTIQSARRLAEILDMLGRTEEAEGLRSTLTPSE